VNIASVLWRLISTDEASQLAAKASKLEHDGSALAVRVQKLLVDAAGIIADARKADQADLAPIIEMLKQL
jgi:hypothetical protein